MPSNRFSLSRFVFFRLVSNLSFRTRKTYERKGKIRNSKILILMQGFQKFKLDLFLGWLFADKLCTRIKRVHQYE